MVDAPAGTVASVKVNDKTIAGFDAIKEGDKAKATEYQFQKAVYFALKDNGYPLTRKPALVPEVKVAGYVAANPK